jgi:phosphotriesterase-related protein
MEGGGARCVPMTVWLDRAGRTSGRRLVSCQSANKESHVTVARRVNRYHLGLSMSNFVPTVRGPIDPAQLGPTLMHEHLFVDWSSALGRQVPSIGSSALVERILCCVGRAAEAGVRTLVDVGPEAIGPPPLLLQLVARLTQVNIVCSTGVYETDLLPAPTWAYPPAGPAEIAERFIAAATDGIHGSGVKPGIIKVGTSPRAITEVEENVLRGAAVAQQSTGLAITTHTRTVKLGVRQIDILEDAGAHLDRVVIGHLGWGSSARDRDLHCKIARRGVFVGLDCVGLPSRSDEEYAQIAADLIEAGYAGQVILSHDAIAYARGVEGVWQREECGGDYAVVHRSLLPLLRRRGVSEETLVSLLVDNPRKVLAVDESRYPQASETLLKPVPDRFLDWMKDMS